MTLSLCSQNCVLGYLKSLQQTLRGIVECPKIPKATHQCWVFAGPPGTPVHTLTLAQHALTSFLLTIPNLCEAEVLDDAVIKRTD